MSSSEAQACPEYYALSRRNFLAFTGSSALAAGLAASTPAWLPRVALAKDYRGSHRDVIISVYLRGAADGMSICVPWGEDAYYANRPNIAVPRPDSGLPDSAIDLGDGLFGLNPRLSALMPAYDNGHLLVVHATGSTDPSRSHFDAQRFMEVGKPDDPTINTGWLGRHLLTSAPTNPDAILRGVGMSPGLQRTLVGGPATLPIPDLDAFGLAGAVRTIPQRQAALSDMYALAPDPLNSDAITTVATINLLNTIDFAGYQPAGGAVYPSGGVGAAFKSSAALIKAEVGVEAIAIDIQGWDTHANQGPLTGALANLLTTLGDTMAAFYSDMFADQSPRVSVVVMSEFGRRLLQNAGGGTDHGHGNMMLVLGQCIAGGRVLSQWPGLQPEQLFEGRDLAVTIDFRDILAEIVRTRLGNTDIDSVFPGYTPTLRGVTNC
jgi:uncharacterized protein (DUF1501 family)